MAIMLGTNVMLSSSSKRNYPSMPFLDWHAFAVVYHPSVLLVRHYGRPGLVKELICWHLRDMGQMVFPDEPDQNYLVRGTDKGVPTLVLVTALIQSGVHYVRLLHFGTKVPYCLFPRQGDIVSECGAVATGGLEENEFHISINVRNSYFCGKSPRSTANRTANGVPHVRSTRHRAWTRRKHGWNLHAKI